MGSASSSGNKRPSLWDGIRAAWAVVRDPEQTERVFEVLGAMSEEALVHGSKRFSQTDVGRRTYLEDTDLIDTLVERQVLADLPTETLGRQYFEFTNQEEITADGLAQASAQHIDQIKDANVQKYALRMRDSHDLWHVLTQYGRDGFGEACLLAFTYAQTRNRGVLLLLGFGSLKLFWQLGYRAIGALIQGYRDGKKAAWLPAQDWENVLSDRVEHVRSRLNIGPPAKYRRVMAKWDLPTPVLG